MDFNEVKLVSHSCQNTQMHKRKILQIHPIMNPYMWKIYTHQHIHEYSCTDCSAQAPTYTHTHTGNCIQEQEFGAAELSHCLLVEENRHWVGGSAKNHCNVITTILTKETLKETRWSDSYIYFCCSITWLRKSHFLREAGALDFHWELSRISMLMCTWTGREPVLHPPLLSPLCFLSYSINSCYRRGNYMK